MATELRRHLTDKNLAIILIIAVLLRLLPLGVLSGLEPLLAVAVAIALLLR